MLNEIDLSFSGLYYISVLHMADLLLMKCCSCGLAVRKLSQCELCGKLICNECLDPFVGACDECVKELLNGNMKCRICGLEQRIDDLVRCSSCGRMVCKNHIFRIEECEECIEMSIGCGEDSYWQYEDEPYFEDGYDSDAIEELGDYDIRQYLHDQHEVEEY